MFHIAKLTWPGLLAGALLLSACSAPTAAATATLDPGTQLTAIASTVQAELTQVSALTPSATFTQAPTETEAATQAPTQPLVTNTPAASPTATRPAIKDNALYVSQGIADNTKMDPGKTFTMTWKVKNTGTTTWTTAYQLRFFAGNRLGADNSVAFPKEVKPGDTVEFSVNMKAPDAQGTYRSNWVLTNSDGLNFFGPIYLDLVVGNPPPATNTPAPAATATTAPATAAPTVTSTP